VFRPFPIIAAAIVLTIVGHRFGAPWIVLLSAALTQAVLLTRRVLAWPALAAAVGGGLAWGACLLLPPEAVPEPGRGAAIFRLDRFPEPPREGRSALEGRVVDAGALSALTGQRVRVDVPGWAGPYRVGDHVRVEGRWRPISGELFLARGLRYRTSVARPPLVVGTTDGGLAVAEQGLQAARDHLVSATGRVAGESAPVVASLVLGVRGDVPREDLAVLVDTGVIHLFAISGGHLAIFGGLLFLGVRASLGRSRWARLRLLDRKVGAVLAVAAALGFALLTGSNVSTMRSFWMISLYFLGIVLDREPDAVTFLAASLTLLLLWSPAALFDPSLQLSAVGVASLFVAGRSAARGLLARGFVASWWAFVLTTPIGYAYFDRLPLATPLANVLLVPLFSLAVMPLAFLVVFTSPWLPTLSGWAAVPLGWLLDATFAGLRMLAAWIPAPTSGLAFGLVFVPLALLGTGLLLAWERRARRAAKALLPG
jgi:competence protein ComEC